MSTPIRREEAIELDRSWLVVVVFVDMVKYSRQSQEVQAEWRERFKQYLTEAIKDCPESGRVILDCGDGAAIVFLGDPEQGLRCALGVLGSIVGEKKGPSLTPMKARLGINLGSVRLVRDINGNIAAAGDGINVGQRVMSFAGDNQILVSRSFYEVASLLADKYSSLFRYSGVQKDKHQREHTLYELHLPGAVPATPALAPETNPKWSLAPAQLATLERQLAHFVGPIARHLVENAAHRAGSAAELRGTLLAILPNQADQETFLHSCHELLPETAGASPSAPAEPAPPASASALDSVILERAQKALASYIGPMARVLVKRAARTAPTPAALYELLAVEIPSATDRAAFLRQSAQP
jgi:class 3 adenylate cyclase